jgi:hypothetical protein
LPSDGRRNELQSPLPSAKGDWEKAPGEPSIDERRLLSGTPKKNESYDTIGIATFVLFLYPKIIAV